MQMKPPKYAGGDRGAKGWTGGLHKADAPVTVISRGIGESEEVHVFVQGDLNSAHLTALQTASTRRGVPSQALSL